MKIESREPASLKRHPIHKAHVPAPDKKSPEWSAFVETIRADGRVRVAIPITKDGLVCDGWWRREAAVDLQLAAVPCEIVEDSEAALLVVESLTARKQMTRGAAAYLALGLLDDYATAANTRFIRNKKASKVTDEEFLDPKIVRLVSTDQDSTERYLAQRWGVAKTTIHQAKVVRNVLHNQKHFLAWIKTIDAESDDAPDLQARLRAEFEPKLFNGDKSLWTVLQAIAGRITTAGSPKITHAQLELFGDSVDTFIKRLAAIDLKAAGESMAELIGTIHDEETLKKIAQAGRIIQRHTETQIDRLKKEKVA